MSHLRRRAALVVAGVALAACSPDRPGAAAGPTGPSASLAPSGGTASALRERERSERERVEQARDASTLAFRAISRGWSGGGHLLRKGSPVLACAPQPYDAEVRVVGPDGGQLRAGPHTLTIPRGALAEPTVVTMEAPVSLAAEVRLSPHGLRFAVPAALAVGYEQCALPRAVQKGVAYVDDELSLLEWTAAAGASGTMVAELWHFSRYALAKRSNYAVAW